MIIIGCDFHTRYQPLVAPVCSPGNHSPALITIQPSFSTIPCKTLNILIKVCYSLPCLSNAILADLAPLFMA